MLDLGARIERMQAFLAALAQSYHISYHEMDLRSVYVRVWESLDFFAEVPIDLLPKHRSLVESPRPEGQANCVGTRFVLHFAHPIVVVAGKVLFVEER
jgi:hypothetical protein